MLPTILQRQLPLASPADHGDDLHPSPRHGAVLVWHGPGPGRRWRKVAPTDPLAQILAGEAGQRDRFISVNEFMGWRLVRLLRSLRAVYADLDGPAAPRSVEAALLACADAGLPAPGLVVLSGRGCHLYWRLADTHPAALPVWQRVQRAVVEALAQWGADRAATDCTRVLRLAGTVNSRAGVEAVGWSVSPERWTLHELADAVLGPRPAAPVAAITRARTPRPAGQRGGVFQLWHSRYRDLTLVAEHHAFMRASGVPEGSRDRLLFLLANALSWFTRAHSLQAEIDQVARTFTPTLTLAEARTYTRPIVRRALATEEGGPDQRYRFRTETIRNWIGDLIEPVESQLRVLVPRHVLDERERERLRRRDGVQQDRASWLAQTTDRHKVAALRAQGWTQKAIADELGITQGRVSQILSGKY